MCVRPSGGEQEWHEHCAELHLLSRSSHQEESSGHNAYCEYHFSEPVKMVNDMKKAFLFVTAVVRGEAPVFCDCGMSGAWVVD